MKQPKQMTEQQALARLTALCSQAEHSTGEVETKMRRWMLPDDVRRRIIDRLTDERYIDDERFCRAFVADKVRFDRWGRRKIEMALARKGIDRAVAARVLDTVDDDQYVEALRPLLESKRRSTSAASEYELNGKLIRFALARGFGLDIVRKCIDDADNYDIAPDEETIV